MRINRRQFVQAGLGCGAAWATGMGDDSVIAATDEKSPVIPVSGHEVEAFKKAQHALLRKYGVTAQSKYLRLKTLPLTAHVLEAGRGAPVLMVHGGGGIACTFAPLIGSLQADFRVMAVDRPGCGLTDTFDYRNTELRSHAVHFIAGALDALGLAQTALVGSSMGGLWALQFALARPERLTKLVLLGEPAGSSPMVNPPPKMEGNPTLDSARAAYRARLVADVERVPPQLLDAVLASRRLPGAAASWNSLRERFLEGRQGTYRLRPELKGLRPPTLFVWGDRDSFAPSRFGEEMAKMAPNARCVVVCDAGHHVWIDQPETVARLTAGFLKEEK